MSRKPVTENEVIRSVKNRAKVSNHPLYKWRIKRIISALDASRLLGVSCSAISHFETCRRFMSKKTAERFERISGHEMSAVELYSFNSDARFAHSNEVYDKKSKAELKKRRGILREQRSHKKVK